MTWSCPLFRTTYNASFVGFGQLAVAVVNTTRAPGLVEAWLTIPHCWCPIPHLLAAFKED